MKDKIKSDLTACKAAFDSVNIPWVIEGGIVLGFARYKDIMEWDTDLDIVVFTEITDKQWRALHSALRKQGFKINAHKKDFMYGKRKVSINIAFYHKDGEFYNSFPESTPGLKLVDRAEWFEPIQLVDFLGDKYPMPNNIEDFVAEHYGIDWKTNIIKNHERYFIEKRGSRDQSAWVTSRAGKHGDLWPKVLKIDDSMEKD